MTRARWLAIPLCLYAAAAFPAAAAPAPTQGRAIASIAGVPLTTRSGRKVTLGSQVSPGKPTLISFWASWCPPCMAEAPYLAKMRRDFGDRYNFLYIDRRDGNPDPMQPAPAVRQFLAHAGLQKIDYLVADVPAYRRIVAGDLKDIPDGKVGIPRLYLFDRDGRQIYTGFGFDPAEAPALEARLKQAIEK